MTAYYEPITYEVTEQDNGMLLKTVLQKRLGVSRKLLSRIKLTERGITLNGERVHISVNVNAGDVVAISLEKEISEDILPQPIPFNIVFEDYSLLIVNKDPGIIVHPTNGHYTGTLANGIVYYWQEKGEMFRFRPVHRLDQDTSGLIAIAKNAYVHQHISEQLIAGQVTKKYVALVHGCPEPEEGAIDGPIDRDPAEPHRRIVIETGYPALTWYKTMASYKRGALVELILGTGRTHQIRVHMTSIGHPLIGDKMYRMLELESKDVLEREAVLTLDNLIPRQALHACELGFRHPITGEPLLFQAPLPNDMEQMRIILADEA
ncbi:RluA family pseudouridine synthase [Paenibacillus anaericanus]|uniref:Pseudouridine synthase n=1 Tax=Paenibacillus anaericanus TaxID=170367 RepID=A0A433Y8V8_9BACL|nr:RluA family pseudouridine synthase [Paenibacillus anaericanus]RUT46325.1 RluA family pseudouridine synthase [Paenibacillus anaericanus]